jgi:drug/metabolite transporter (DMT)-like permease
MFLFHERLNSLQAVGLLLAIIGLIMTAYFRKSYALLPVRHLQR